MTDQGVASHEHLGFRSDLSLKPLCAGVRFALGLPAFEFGAENENAWGLCRHEAVEYNVSMPPGPGTLQKWDGTVPDWCNVGLTLLVMREHPRAADPAWIVTTLVRGVGDRLSAALRCPVIYHRSSLALPGAAFQPHVFAPPGRR